MSNFKFARVAVPALMAFSAGVAQAQDVSINFTNAPDVDPIPLLTGTSVGIDGEGNLSAQCVLDGESCVGMPEGGPVVGPVPTVTLSRTGTGTVLAGTNLALNWQVQNAAEICVTSSSPTVSGWNGTVVAATGGSANVTLPAAGDYTLSLKCYNQYGVSTLSTVSVTATGLPPQTGIPNCTVEGIADGKVRVQPEGFTGHNVSWSNLMFGATFPDGKSHLSPVGSFTLRALSTSTRGPTMNARYITTPFTAGPNANYSISWLGAQRIDAAGYTQPRAADTVFVSISPCAGDLRAYNGSGDNWLKRCRAQISSGKIFFGTSGGLGQCPLQAGQPYFINIAFVNTSGTDPLPLTGTTCASGDRCEANFDGL